MKWKSYLLLCVIVSVMVIGAIEFVPGLAENIEARLIAFLSSNAR